MIGNWFKEPKPRGFHHRYIYVDERKEWREKRQTSAEHKPITFSRPKRHKVPLAWIAYLIAPVLLVLGLVWLYCYL